VGVLYTYKGVYDMATVYIGRPGSFSVNADEGTATPEVLWTQNAIKQALIDTSGKSFNDMAARLNAIDAAISAKAAQGDLNFVLVNSYNADATGVNDSLPAFNAALATGKNVVALPGTYKVTGTIVVPRKGSLILNAGVTIKPSGDFNVIQIKPDSKTYGNGCTIDTSGLTSFTMAGIYATGQDRFSVVNELTIVDGFNIRGKDHESDVGGSSTSYTGKGIHFYSGNNWAAGFSGQAYIAYIQASNINISNFYRGIWLEREKAPVNGSPWITSCTFDQINMYAAMRSIDITTNDSFYNGGHLFTNIQLQANTFSERYIYCDGSNNQFSGEFWDLEDYFEPRNVPCFEFNTTAHENTINGTQFFSLDKHVLDKNNGSSGNPMKPNRFNSLINPVNILAPVVTNNVRSLIGDQDDILAGASKAYTVTKTSAHVSGGGSIDAMFQPNKGSFYSLNGVDEANNCIIEIDFGANPVSEIDMVGFLFRQDSNSYVPKYIKMDLLDAGGAVLATKSITNNTQGMVYFSTYASSTTKMRLTFGSSNDQTVNRRIRIYRIFATAIGASGKSWLNTAEGGTVYGDVNFGGYIQVGKSALPTASATYRGKIIRVEGATGVADVCYICMKSATDTYSWKAIVTG
jgi:hypothetical protein